MTARRDAVVFAWFVPERMPELGYYYLGLLREYHADSKVFVGMNHGSDPAWEERIRDSGLDVEVRWARPEIGDYWDATGFLTALEGFHRSDERFQMVWFGHTKGGSQRHFEDYVDVRSVTEERFWRRREWIERLFDDPVVGIFTPNFCPLPPAYYARELYALERVYRDRYAPLGLHAQGTFFTLRGEIVRRFCDVVGDEFFSTPPGAYDGGRFLFEIGFPSIATMQGFEPFIDPDVPGDNDPRDDVWIVNDVKQNHRIAKKELARWRADRTGFRPREMKPAGDNLALKVLAMSDERASESEPPEPLPDSLATTLLPLAVGQTAASRGKLQPCGGTRRSLQVPEMDYLELLDQLHTALQPAVYLEVGVYRGESLALSHSRSIAIDPTLQVRSAALSGKPWIKLYQQTSDDFFRTHTADVLEEEPLDLVFLDGLHEFAQVVRDLQNVERWAHQGTVVLIHDVLPNTTYTATRAFHAGEWTGDVWRIVPFLREHRPDLECRLINVRPSGVLVVTRLNPHYRGMAEIAAALDREFPPDGREYEALVNAYLASECPVTPEALRDLPGLSRHFSQRENALGWSESVETAVAQLKPGTDAEPPRIVLAEPLRVGYRIRLTLTAAGMPLLCLALGGARGASEWERRVFVDVERPGALHHELERVALHAIPEDHEFEIEVEGALQPGETLREIALTPLNADLDAIPATKEMRIGIRSLRAEQGEPRPGARFLPERFREYPASPKQKCSKRDAVVFSWFVPEHMPELGDYYLGLLRYYHPDSRLFIGMNHGSASMWEDCLRDSGLDVAIRWARSEVGDFWDATGFLTALEQFHESEEVFDLVWFGHTKGASGAQHTDYDRNRIDLQRNFWARRSEIDRIFDDPKIGVFARRFTPWWDGPAGDELPALLRVYRDEYAPLGLGAFDTFFVLREGIVRRFCHRVAAGFFQTSPGTYGANRWFFEMGIPSIATMQGFEPYIDPNVAGEDDPRDDVWLRYDPKQNHRLLKRELDRWRFDPVAYEPVRIQQIWSR